MKRLLPAVAPAVFMAAVFLAGGALAQPYPGHDHGGYEHHGDEHGPPPGHGGYERHEGYAHGPPRREVREWHRGDRYDGRCEWVDWRREHLREPPHGYEWVDEGGQFVLIAITTGIIADVLLHAAQGQ
jgi:Ni/Co efflux regulator RcnB